MNALDVSCPYCGAAPTEPCLNVRYERGVEYGRGAARTHSVAHGGRRTKRPHPERIEAARS